MKKTKKLMCVLLSIAMIAAAFASVGSVAFAEEPAVIASGECGADGGNLTWTLTGDDVLTVSGTGAMADYGEVYVIDDAELERVYREYPVIWKNPEAKPQLAFIGCPHLTLQQLTDWARPPSMNAGRLCRREPQIWRSISACRTISATRNCA